MKERPLGKTGPSADDILPAGPKYSIFIPDLQEGGLPGETLVVWGQMWYNIPTVQDVPSLSADRRSDDETNLSAQTTPSQAASRISPPHEQPGGTTGVSPAPGEGTPTSVRLGVRGEKVMALPRVHRLCRSGDFQKVFQEGRYWRGHHLTLLIRRRTSGGMRIGWSIRRSLGGAVVRNRLRRRLSEACRQAMISLKGHADLIAIPAPSAVEAPLSELREDFSILCRRAGLEGGGNGRPV